MRHQYPVTSGVALVAHSICATHKKKNAPPIALFPLVPRKGVILTKDNLAKRNWHGYRKRVFGRQDETIKHIFFQCRFARSVWSVIQVASTLYPPRSIANIFGNWLNGIDHRFKKHIRVGAIAFI
jgi:hypothetical protein